VFAEDALRLDLCGSDEQLNGVAVFGKKGGVAKCLFAVRAAKFAASSKKKFFADGPSDYFA
jgi:hypothetical protein